MSWLALLSVLVHMGCSTTTSNANFGIVLFILLDFVQPHCDPSGCYTLKLDSKLPAGLNEDFLCFLWARFKHPKLRVVNMCPLWPQIFGLRILEFVLLDEHGHMVQQLKY